MLWQKKMKKTYLSILLVLVAFFHLTNAASKTKKLNKKESALISWLLNNSNAAVIPKLNKNEAINVTFGIRLIQARIPKIHPRLYLGRGTDGFRQRPDFLITAMQI